MPRVAKMLIFLTMAICLANVANAAVPHQISFQGKLTDSGGSAIKDSTYTVVFGIYSDSTGGTALWQETQQIETKAGLFQVLLGSIVAIPDSVFNDSTTYLSTQIGATALLPRKSFGSAAYAYKTSGSAGAAEWSVDGDNIYRLNGNVGVGISTPETKLHVNGKLRTNAIGIGPGTPWYDVGICLDAGFQETRIAWSNRTNCDFHIYEDGPAQKLIFRSYGGGSLEEWKWISAGLGELFTIGPNIIMNRNVGIGTTNPTAKLHVVGDILSTGTIYGNFSGSIDNALHWNGNSWGDTYPFSSNSNMVDGLHGTQFLRSDAVNGVVQASDNNPSEVIRSENWSTAHASHAISGYAHSPDGGTGVYGEGMAAGPADNGIGVWGITYSASGEQPPQGCAMGVFGEAKNTGNGDAFGVLGRCNTHGGSGNPTAGGVFGWGDVTSGSTYGVWGETRSSDTWVSGVYGVNTATTGETRGVTGVTNSTGSNAMGVLGWAPGSGNVKGVEGYCHSASGYGVYSEGNFAVAPGYTKSAVVEVSKGAVKMYCQESPEIWFEDFGEGQLTNGRASIELDPTFLETVTINSQHIIKVFVQLNDDCNGVYVKRDATGFDVIELQSGKSNAAFTYRVVAKRKGFEDKRLEKTEVVTAEFQQPLSPTAVWKDK